MMVSGGVGRQVIVNEVFGGMFDPVRQIVRPDLHIVKAEILKNQRLWEDDGG